jgi:hypothetical protein
MWGRIVNHPEEYIDSSSYGSEGTVIFAGSLLKLCQSTQFLKHRRSIDESLELGKST